MQPHPVGAAVEHALRRQNAHRGAVGGLQIGLDLVQFDDLGGAHVLHAGAGAHFIGAPIAAEAVQFGRVHGDAAAVERGARQRQISLPHAQPIHQGESGCAQGQSQRAQHNAPAQNAHAQRMAPRIAERLRAVHQRAAMALIQLVGALGVLAA